MHGTYRKFLRVARGDLVYLKFIVEAYEGLAVLSTVTPEGPVVQLSTPLCREPELTQLIDALAREIDLTEVPTPQAPETVGGGARHA